MPILSFLEGDHSNLRIYRRDIGIATSQGARGGKATDKSSTEQERYVNFFLEKLMSRRRGTYRSMLFASRQELPL